MIHGKWLVLDRYCEVYDLLRPHADAYFYDVSTYNFVPNSIVVLDGFGRSRGELDISQYKEKVKNLIHSRPDLLFVFCKPSEAGETLEWHIPVLGFGSEAMYKKMLVIGGGEMDNRYACLSYERFLERVWDIEHNQQCLKSFDEIYNVKNKKYKFLLLSGRAREHRKYLLEKLELSKVLDQGLYSCLDSSAILDKGIRLFHDGRELLSRPREIKYLPPEYEIESVRDRIGLPSNNFFVKYDLFNGEWLDGFINLPCYTDTYFSIITETSFYYPYSFRTEKIWKAIMAGHPWIAATNKGFYKDLRNLGFKTFENLIDESFDSIENSEERIKKVSEVIIDLCNQDLNSFLLSAKDICYHNQQHMKEMYSKIKREFPQRFFDFINVYMRKDI